MYNSYNSHGLKDVELFKSLAIVQFLLITLSIYILNKNPASGYESSIYIGTSASFWILIILNIVISLGVIILGIAYKKFEINTILKIYLIAISLSILVIISIPLARNYIIWGRGDTATHISHTIEIIANGYIVPKNFYPILHIFTSMLVRVTDISILKSVLLMPLLFSGFFMLSFFVFLKSLSLERDQVILAYLASIIGIAFLHSYVNDLIFSPHHLGNLYIPFALYISTKTYTPNLKENIINYKLISIIICLLLPIFHPYVAFSFFILLLSIYISAQRTLSSKSIMMGMILILIIWTFTWLSSFYVIQSFLANLIILSTEEVNTNADIYISNINLAQTYGYSPLVQFIKAYGNLSIYSLLTIFSFAILFKKYKNKFNLSIPFCLSWIISVMFIILIFITNLMGGPTRGTGFLVILSIPFVGISLQFIISYKSNKFFIYLVLLILLSTYILGIFRFFPSPYLLTRNDMISQSELNGMKWIFDYHDDNIDIDTLSITPLRFGFILLNKSFRSNMNLLFGEKTIPFHFNYDISNTLSNYYPKEIYIALNEMDKTIYRDIFPEMAQYRFTSNDFKKLLSDPSVERIYNSVGMEIYVVRD